ncbi:MAG: DUF4126 domain-containing protein [Acidobacteriia bacterium]|nr:DUF4126 domain-containing protein [Terriglobia bacterium]
MSAISFAAGWSVHATVATLGRLTRAGFLALPPSPHLVGSWPVIATCAVMFVMEFFADKIPTFDWIWNALHAFVRVPVAGSLAYAAAAHLSSLAQAISASAGGAIALAAHGGKTAARAAGYHNPPNPRAARAQGSSDFIFHSSHYEILNQPS